MYLGNFRNANKIPLFANLSHADEVITIIKKFKKEKLYTDRLHPKVQSFTLIHSIFDRIGAPFVNLALKHGTSHTYLCPILYPNTFYF